MQETFIALKSHYIVNQKWSETKGKKIMFVCRSDWQRQE